MNAGIAGQLSIVVDAGVQRLMRVLDVVRHDRGKEHGVAGSERLPREALEGAPQIPELFLLPPRQQPVPTERGDAELLDRCPVLARQFLERILA